MAVIKEWECALHGTFECTHPVCPEFNCESENVKQVFLTPPKIASGQLKLFDQGIRRSAELMGISNFRSARAGETAYGGDAGKRTGLDMLWVSGKEALAMAATAQQPLTVNGKTLTRNNGMQEAATELGITQRALPKAAEVFGDRETPRSKIKSIT